MGRCDSVSREKVFLFSFMVLGFSVSFPFGLRSASVPQRGMIFPLLQVERKTRIGNRSRAIWHQSFSCCASVRIEKVWCPLTGWLAFWASCRKGSGALPAGRLEGLRCFTIRKANWKIKKSSRLAAFLRSYSLISYSLDLPVRSSARSVWRPEP